MWTVINNQDMSRNLHMNNFSLDLALSDPLNTTTLEMVDINSTLNLAFGQTVMIWDENAAPDHTINGIPVQCVPALNLVTDPIFSLNANANFAKGGPYQSTITLSFANAAFVFNNQALTGLSNASYVVQTPSALAPGYVTPGQKYMFAIFCNSSGATNLNYYFQINWLDANRNFLSNSSSGFTTPPTSNTHLSLTGVAPANAAFAQAQFGVYATNTTNSGTVNFGTLQIEPVWFPGQAMGNGVPITYPSPDCNFNQVNTYIMPDGTYARNNRLFYGYIAHLEVMYEGTKRTYKIDCRTMGDVIESGGVGTPIDTTYTGFTDAAIINDIVNKYYNGILSTGQLNSSQPITTVVTGATLDAVSFTNQTFREVLNNIVDITGYAYYIDPYMHIRYNPIPYNYALFSLRSDPNSAPDYVSTFPPQDYTYISDGTQIRNSVKVTGGTFQITVQDLFQGDGATKFCNLSNTPINIVSISFDSDATVYAPTKNNKIGVQGQDVLGVGGIVALMDASNKRVTFNNAPPASNGNNIVISYIQDRTVSILVEENSSIGQYRRRFVSKVEDSNLSSNAAGKTRGESEIAQWAFPVQNITFKLSSEMGINWQPINMFLVPGTTILFTSPLDGLTSQPFVIQTVQVTSMGGGMNIYNYDAGVYKPRMNDYARNVQKALARNPSTGGTTPIQLTYEVLRDQTLYVDSVAFTIQTVSSFVYGTAKYGFASFS